MKRIIHTVCAMMAALVAEAASPAWTLSLDSTAANTVGTMTDGTWQIHVAVCDGTKRQLVLGTTPYVSGQAEPTAGNALCRDENGGVIGSGVLDLRGTITRSSDASVWTVVSLGNRCFSGSSTSEVSKQGTYYSPFTELYLPSTLVNYGFESRAFEKCGSSGTRPTLVAFADDSTDAIRNNMFIGSSIRNLRLKTPQLKSLGGYDISNDFLSETDVSDWDLSSVFCVGVNVSSGGGGWTSWGELDAEPCRTFFRGKTFKGTLRLPALKSVPFRLLENCTNLGAFDVGATGDLTSVCSNATLGCTSLSNVWLRTGMNRVTLDPGAFGAANLRTVTFTGTKRPAFTASGLVFGTEDTPAKSIVFRVPPKSPCWNPVRAYARAVTDAERAAVSATWGADTASRLVGVVPAEAFRTAHEQYLAESGEARPSLSVSVCDPRFTGDAAVVVSPAPGADGCYETGTKVTIRATPGTEGAFKKWIGFPDGTELDAAETTVTLTESLSLKAVFTHKWTYYSSEGIISNAIWTLKVYANNATAHLLTLGVSSSSAAGNAFATRGNGMLDLNGAIVSADGDVNWKISALESKCLQLAASGAYSKTGADYPTTLVLPETLTYHGTQSVRYGTETTFVMILPNLSSDFGQDWMGSLNLSQAVFRMPKVTVLRYQNGLSYQSTVDVTPWDLSGVTDIPSTDKDNGLLKDSFFAKRKFHGTLHFPSLTDVASNAFLQCVNMEGIALGTCTRARAGRKPVRIIREQAFKDCTGLSRLTLFSGADLDVSADAFSGAVALGEIHFTGAVPSTTALDRILTAVAAPAADDVKPVIIYGSRAQGWSSVAKTPTAAELAVAPVTAKASDLLGVYESANGSRKAWIVHQSSPCDPVGVAVVLR